MRFSTATISALLAISGASASVLPRFLDAYDLAQPITEREVPLLQCADEPIFVGQLQMISASGREAPAAFEGLRNDEGLQMLDVQKMGQPARYENFAFTSCNSTFMNYETTSTKAAEVFFGRLQPAHLMGKRCVSADGLAKTDARLVADKCDPSDDSGQLLQFWSLTKQPATNADKFEYYVNFLGQPSGDNADFPGGYTLNKAIIGANKIIRLQHSPDEGKQSAYYLKLANPK